VRGYLSYMASMTFRISDELQARFVQVCAGRGVKVSEGLRLAIEAFVESDDSSPVERSEPDARPTVVSKPAVKRGVPKAAPTGHYGWAVDGTPLFRKEPK
jgi:antitoxin component of RelBE/YafQ-DinJ toxin-antitoxin module